LRVKLWRVFWLFPKSLDFFDYSLSSDTGYFPQPHHTASPALYIVSPDDLIQLPIATLRENVGFEFANHTKGRRFGEQDHPVDAREAGQ
jgi:hypothetical protein